MVGRGDTAKCGRDRRGYTLAELMLLVVLAAILVAIFLDIRRQFSVSGRWIHSITVSADGKRVAAGMRDGSVRVWDTATGETTAALGPLGPAMYMNALALSPDASLVARPRDDVMAIEVFDLKSGKELLNRQVGFPVGGLAFSSDGKRLAYQLGRTAKDLGIVNLDESDASDITASASTSAIHLYDYGFIVAMSFSPDQESLYVVKDSGEFAVWDVAKGQVTRASLAPPTDSAIRYDSAALSPAPHPAYRCSTQAAPAEPLVCIACTLCHESTCGNLCVRVLGPDSVHFRVPR
jgi:WD40 repeat protein